MTVKLYDYRSARVESGPRDSMYGYAVPEADGEPFADSAAQFSVVEPGRSSAYQYAPKSSDMKPFALCHSDGTMQVDPPDFESKWSAEGNDGPFTLIR